MLHFDFSGFQRSFLLGEDFMFAMGMSMKDFSFRGLLGFGFWLCLAYSAQFFFLFLFFFFRVFFNLYVNLSSYKKLGLTRVAVGNDTLLKVMGYAIEVVRSNQGFRERYIYNSFKMK